MRKIVIFACSALFLSPLAAFSISTHQSDDNPCKVIFTPLHSFKLPFKLDSDPLNVSEIILFLSTDEGLTWEVAGKVSPLKDYFVYTAPKEGTYWFSLQVVGTDGSKEPPKITRNSPGLTVIVLQGEGN